MSLKFEGEIIDYKKIEKAFLDHKSKTFEATMADFMIASNRKMTEKQTKCIIDKILIEIKKSKNEYNKLKNDSLYVRIKDNKFISPNNSVTIKDAKSTLLKAKDRLEATFGMAEREVNFDLENGTHPKFHTDL